MKTPKEHEHIYRPKPDNVGDDLVRGLGIPMHHEFCTVEGCYEWRLVRDDVPTDRITE